jgi:hypothetical protein
MREFYLNWELPNYLRQRSLGGFVEASLGKLWSFAKGFGRFPTLALALIGLPLAPRRWRWSRIALLIVVVCVLNSLPVLTYFPHYSAPVAPLIILLLAAGGLAIRQRWKLAGRVIIAIILIGQSIALVHWMIGRANADPHDWTYVRQAFIDAATRENKKVLVFVRADPGYYAHNEYVYNSADIDRAAVVWARDMGHERNRDLIDYYNRQGGRELMLLDNGQRLIPYNETK